MKTITAISHSRDTQLPWYCSNGLTRVSNISYLSLLSLGTSTVALAHLRKTQSGSRNVRPGESQNLDRATYGTPIGRGQYALRRARSCYLPASRAYLTVFNLPVLSSFLENIYRTCTKTMLGFAVGT